MIYWLCIACCATLINRASAQTVQNGWKFPAYPNFASNVTIGKTYSIAWHSDLQDDFGEYCPKCNPSEVDLWVQTGDDDNHAYKIGSGLNVETTYQYTWVVKIPVADLIVDKAWVLRFIPYNSVINPTGGQVSSSLFYVNAPPSASSTGTSTSTAAPTKSTQPSSSSSSSSSSSTGLSTGAKAGIGVGAGLAAVLLLASVIFSCWRSTSRRSPQTQAPQSQEPETAMQYQHAQPGATASNPHWSLAYGKITPYMGDSGRSPSREVGELEGSQPARSELGTPAYG